MDTLSLPTGGRPLITLQINNMPIDCFCDTGTADSILNPCFGHTLESDPVTTAVCEPTSRVATRPLMISGVGGGHCQIDDAYSVDIGLGPHSVASTILVCKKHGLHKHDRYTWRCKF